MDYRELIKSHEGFSYEVFADTEGVPTVGWGHAFFGPTTPAIGTVFSLERCTQLFEEDMQIVERQFITLEENFFYTHRLDYVRRGVIKNMLFNLGYNKFLGFKKMIAYLKVGDWAGTSREMLDSKWARQVKGRANELAHLMLYGVLYYKLGKEE